MIYETAIAFIVAAGIPSAITSFCFWKMQKELEKREKEHEEKEHAKKENEILLIKLAGASLSLGEATAKAVQRIPDAHCNGDMRDALEYAQEIKHMHKEMLYDAAIDNLI